MSIDLEQLDASLAAKPWWEKTVDEVACGRCDKLPAGRGAASVVDPVKGLIVACGKCQREIAKERAEIEAVNPRRRDRRPRALVS